MKRIFDISKQMKSIPDDELSKLTTNGSTNDPKKNIEQEFKAIHNKTSQAETIL